MDKECTCKEAPEFVRNSWHTEGCPQHCSHPGINTLGDWSCRCGADQDFPWPGGAEHWYVFSVNKDGRTHYRSRWAGEARGNVYEFEEGYMWDNILSEEGGRRQVASGGLLTSLREAIEAAEAGLDFGHEPAEQPVV